MKCEECQQFLEEYIDGELEMKLAAQVSAHASNCSDCSKAYQELKQELEVYAHYQRDVEVTPALWAGVEARIRHEKAALRPRGLAGLRERLAVLFATPRFSPALAAALVLVAIGLTVVVMSVMNSQNNNQPLATDLPPQQSSPNNANKPVEPPAPKPDEKRDELAGDGKDTDKQAPVEKENKPAVQKQLVAKAPPKQADPAQLVREAEQKYIAAISILSRDVNRRRSQIDPTVLARFDNALSDIDRTINETRRVVREHPDDPIALQYLLSAYAKKVDALRDMALD
jgi:hypothetical protein